MQQHRGGAELAERIAMLPQPLLVALDVDGTLAPIVEDPSQARVPPGIADTLRQLHAPPAVSIALVTGRDAASLAAIAPIESVYRAVEHGRVVLRPGEVFVAPAIDPELRAALLRFESLARARFAPRGARIEVKASACAVHTRALATHDSSSAETILADAEALALHVGLHPRRGRSVLEAETLPGDKGAAIDRLVELTGAVSVVYAGDDLTDGPAIERAMQRGIGIFVASSDRPTAPSPCTASLAGPDAVAALIRTLAARLC